MVENGWQQKSYLEGYVEDFERFEKIFVKMARENPNFYYQLLSIREKELLTNLTNDTIVSGKVRRNGKVSANTTIRAFLANPDYQAQFEDHPRIHSLLEGCSWFIILIDTFGEGSVIEFLLENL